MLEKENQLLYRDLIGCAIDVQEECPGVQYLCVKQEDGVAAEYYIVARESEIISDEAKRYGVPCADRSDLLLYDLNDVTSGRAIVEYEIRKNKVINKQHQPDDETISSYAEYAAELHPEYFGILLPPRMTPCGNTLRWRSLMNGLYLHETETCEQMVSVCPPLCENDLSDYTQGVGQSEDKCLFFTKQNACLAVFELAHDYPVLKKSEMIHWPALMTSIWKYHPGYAVAFNINEQRGLHDSAALLFNSLGIECEAESSPENMIAVSADCGTDYLFF